MFSDTMSSLVIRKNCCMHDSSGAKAELRILNRELKNSLFEKVLTIMFKIIECMNDHSKYGSDNLQLKRPQASPM